MNKSILLVLLIGIPLMGYNQKKTAVPLALASEMAATIMHKWPDSLSNKPGSPVPWSYDLGVFFDGMTRIYEQDHDMKYITYMRHIMDLFIREDGTIGRYNPSDYNIDNIKNGRTLLFLYKTTGLDKYKKAASLLRKQLLMHPRTDEGGFWHKKVYPHQMWLDGIYMGEPFYAEWSSTFHEDNFDDIARQFTILEKHARDPETGLLYHGWDEAKKQKWADKTTGNSPNFWGRAMGWYGMALVDVLDFFPKNHPKRAELIAILNRYVAAIRKVQQPGNGLWYQVLDKSDEKGNYPEASASCMFVYTMAKALNNNYISQEYLPVVNRGFEGVKKEFLTYDGEGRLHLKGTVQVSGLGGTPFRSGTVQYYLSEPVITDDAKGMGAFILCATEISRLPALAKSAAGPSKLISRYPFGNTRLSFEKRVDDLVGRLTLEEKVSQMLNAAPAIPRLGIPAHDWWNEVLHGVARTPYKTTVFPQAIAMAATFDRDALFRMADYSALEGRAIYNKAITDQKSGAKYLGLTYWTPNINIFRDPRWGRGQETYGEDPFLTASLGDSFVRGLQGDDPRYLKAAACAKHYAVHSGPEPDRHVFNADVSAYDLWDTYLPAFEKLVVKSKVAGVMCAYNAFRTQPCCGSDILMTDILRRQWNFKGYVTSDCGAIDDFYKQHKTHPDAAAAAADAVMHGTDLDCGKEAYLALVQAVKNGSITEKQIDISVKRLFMIRFRLGLFDPVTMVKYAQTSINVLESPEHRQHALKMARESMVLLRNENSTLPLSKNLKKIVVLGPNADNSVSILGNYNGHPSELTTVLAGIREKVGKNSTVIYEKAVNFTNNTILVQGDTSKGTVTTDFGLLVEKHKDADAFIFVGGIAPQLEGEQMSVNEQGFMGGDRTSIMLPEIQTALMKKLQATGKAVVFVMMTGSAIAIPWESEHIPAILNAWYGGQAAGSAVADILFGDYNPSGRLPVTFYRSESDLTDFKDYSMKNRTYRYFKGKPLYGFGYGLSYTSFKYTQKPFPKSVRKGEKLVISVQVTNNGNISGEEVVQLYLVNQNKQIKTSLKALKGFQRVSLAAGETRSIRFVLPPEELCYVDADGTKKSIRGNVQFSVGGSQPDEPNPTSGNLVKSMVSIL